MSKVVRRRLLETIELLQQGTQAIGRLVEEDRREECLELLTDCQELAIAFGTRIEQLKGEGTAVVSALEDYCENIYQIGELLQKTGLRADGEQTDEKVPKGQYTALCSQFVRVQEKFESDFPDKLEVVFLPYKASMWDALESVWMAARDDENCEAYVIPIPYYTLDGQHYFKDFCYEGDQYPDDVPVTDYRDYDLKLHHPDMIFVHNPYDSFNTVTSVAPEYYLKTIREYTEKLVYIPYFVLDEIDPDDQATIDGMKHFCFLPGTMYADRVIVQSEEMRTIYINEFMKACKERGLQADRELVEKKFLGLGSPKFDKVFNTAKEDLDIPEEWLRIIEKPDGNWKKIVFYNTSINALLRHDEQMLVKMKDVFRIFQENKEEVALLWRPHPLIRDTIESMRPHLWGEYQKLVRQYKEDGWGIYDDTADMDRAVVLSDAYYGDESSVLNLYQGTGKPAMVQSLHAMYYKTQGMIYNDGLYRENDTFWFVGSEDNVLYKMKISSMEVAAVALLPQKGANFYRRYPRCIKSGNCVYCLPDRAPSIQIYDLKKKAFNSLVIDNPCNCRLSLINNWLENDRIWSVSYGLNQILEINVEQNVVENVYSIFTNPADTCGYEAAKVENMIFCVSKESPTVVKFSTESCERVEFHLNVQERGFNTIVYADGKFYLSGYSDKIYCWDGKSMQTEDHDITDMNLFVSENSETPRFYQSVLLEDYLVFVPLNSTVSTCNCLLYLDLKTNVYDKLVFKSQDMPGILRGQFTIEYKIKKLLGVHDFNNLYITEIDMDNREMTRRRMKRYSDGTNHFIEYCGDDNRIIMESLYYGLEMFLKTASCKKNGYGISSAGESVWNALGKTKGE